MDMSQKTENRDRRAAITDIATDLFLANGFAGTSMHTIAAASGITKASLYHHFTGKEDLFVACVTHGYRDALRALEALAGRTDTPADRLLREAMHLLYDAATSSAAGRMSPLIAEVSRAFPTVARSFHAEYVVPQERLLWQIVEQGIDAGLFRPIAPRQLFHMVCGPIVTLSLSREMFASFDDLDSHFPIATLRDGHIDAVLRLLAAG